MRSAVRDTGRAATVQLFGACITAALNTGPIGLCTGFTAMLSRLPALDSQRQAAFGLPTVDA